MILFVFEPVIHKTQTTNKEAHMTGADGLMPTSHSLAQILGLLSIFLLVLDPSQCNSITAQCVEHTYCSSTLKEYHTQLISLPSRINERSVAAWSYV